MINPKELVIGTRVFGSLGPEKFDSVVGQFIDYASSFGLVVIVSQLKYSHIAALVDYVDKFRNRGKRVVIAPSNTDGANSPADMVNRILYIAEVTGAERYSVVSGDLVEYVGNVIPRMSEVMNEDSTVATVGVAIQNVHDLALLKRVKEIGMNALTSSNYATLFHNNALSLHATSPVSIDGESIPREDAQFSRKTDQGTLGNLLVEGTNVPVGGNEEIFRMLYLLGSGKRLNVRLLDGLYTIIRDPKSEISSVDKKIQRRPQVAERYRTHLNVPAELIEAYLHDGSYRILLG